ncbi:hypothetical protein CJJ07_004372 [Candidozyma auris]|nr:hypothetical protein CJJ07_004372 [[Candida] auris]
MKFSTVAIALTAASAVSAANQTGGGKNDSGNQTSSSVGGMAAANAMGAGVIGAAAAAAASDYASRAIASVVARKRNDVATPTRATAIKCNPTPLSGPNLVSSSVLRVS